MFLSKADPEIESTNRSIDISKLPLFTRPELAAYNGIHKKQIYIAVKGFVYDVTNNDKNYGPGKSYHKLVGKDCSRLLGLGKLNLPEDSVPNTWKYDDLTEKQQQSLENWAEFYKKRYKIVGIVVGHDS